LRGYENKYFSKRLILASQYFLYFGVMGAFLPYFNLYCYHLGFSGFQIGILSSVRSITMILCPLLWGILADRFNVRKPIYIFCNILSSLIWIFFLVTSNFWLILIITLCHGFFYTPIISFLEAFTMDILGKAKKDYGHIRAWGSGSFVVTVLIFGWLIDLYSIEIILIFILAGSLMQALIALKIPSITIKKKPPASGKVVFVKGRVILFLFCGFLMLASHGTYYGFFSIHLTKSGFSNSFIGIAWGLASLSEIFIMVNSARIFKNFSLESILLFSFLTAFARWLLLSFSASASVIILTQILHAITYGTFHIASILYIDSMSPEKNKTLGQAINNAATYGLGMMTGFLINGYLFDKIGAYSLFLLNSLISITAFFLFWSFCKIPRKTMKDNLTV